MLSPALMNGRNEACVVWLRVLHVHVVGRGEEGERDVCDVLLCDLCNAGLLVNVCFCLWCREW